MSDPVMHSAGRQVIGLIARGDAWLAACAVALTLTLSGDARAADGPPDADTVEIWQKARTSFFGDREIRKDTNAEVIELRVPGRAQDAAVVPVSVSTRLTASPARYVSKIWLFIDQNPSPVAAVFTFTADSGKADIDTRVRVEDYTWMRAVAETSDGKLYVSERFVKAAGGCSAPYGTAPDFDAFNPRVKLKLDASVVPGKPALAQLLIQHPNSSGLAKDQITHLYIPAYYVRTIDITYAGKPIMSADVDFSISENPNFRFFFTAREAGELKAAVVDTKERHIEESVRVEIDERGK